MATVLVVDDDRVVSQLVAAVLRGKGHKVFTAFDAVQGLMQAKQKPSVDAIVLDVNMPGGSGEETLRKIKMSTHTQNNPRHHPEWQHRCRALTARRDIPRHRSFSRAVAV